MDTRRFSFWYIICPRCLTSRNLDWHQRCRQRCYSNDRNPAFIPIPRRPVQSWCYKIPFPYSSPYRPYTSRYCPQIPISNAKGREFGRDSHFSTRVKEWNEELRKQCTLFKEKHDDIFLEVYDTTTIFNAVVESPDKYGLVDTDEESTDLEHRVWYDGFHASAAMHKILAEDIALFLGKFE
jgi:hypothetical protein